MKTKTKKRLTFFSHFLIEKASTRGCDLSFNFDDVFHDRFCRIENTSITFNARWDDRHLIDTRACTKTRSRTGNVLLELREDASDLDACTILTRKRLYVSLRLPSQTLHSRAGRVSLSPPFFFFFCLPFRTQM